MWRAVWPLTDRGAVHGEGTHLARDYHRCIGDSSRDCYWWWPVVCRVASCQWPSGFTLRLATQLQRGGHATALLPNCERSRVTVRSQPTVLRDETPSVLNRCRVDQAVRRVAWKGRGQRYGGGGDCWRDWNRPHKICYPFEPGADRDSQSDSFVLGQPSELEPRDGRDRKLIGLDHRLGSCGTHSLRFRRPPMNHVAVE